MSRVRLLKRGGASDPRGTYLTGGWQAFKGPGVLRYASMDGTSLSSNVLKFYDLVSPGETLAEIPSVDRNVIGTWTQDTDFGTTVPVAVFSSGSIVATLGTSSADTHRGIPFADGLFVNKTWDTTHDANVTLMVSRLIKKSIDVGGQGAATHSVPIFDGPGILHGVRIRTDYADVALGTGDLVFKDAYTPGSGNTLWTGTDFVTGGPSSRFASTTTGIDNAGSAATTAATGAYANEGIAFFTGLHLAAAGLNTAAGVRSYTIDCLIEA